MNKIKLYLKSIVSNKILCLDNTLKDVKTSFNFKGNLEHAKLFDSIEAANEYIIEHELTALRARPIEYKSKDLYFYFFSEHKDKKYMTCFFEGNEIDFSDGRKKLRESINLNSCIYLEFNRQHEFYEIVEYYELIDSITHLKY
jgi:hypothetical protein